MQLGTLSGGRAGSLVSLRVLIVLIRGLHSGQLVLIVGYQHLQYQLGIKTRRSARSACLLEPTIMHVAVPARRSFHEAQDEKVVCHAML